MPSLSRLFHSPRRKTDPNNHEHDAGTTTESKYQLSHVGEAAYAALRRHHNKHHRHKLWNVTNSQVVTNSDELLLLTPRDAFTRETNHDPPKGHDDWFPERLCEIISRTEEWCDILSLEPPDGLFLTHIRQALTNICQKKTVLNGRITIRFLFGNLPGLPVNSSQVLMGLIHDLPPGADKKIKLWVGSWRKDLSWNHSKIIAVDGQYLWTGGHNFRDRHYLKNNPVIDLSLELAGDVTQDAHHYANAQWSYIVKKQSTLWGRFVDQCVSNAVDVPRRARVSVAVFPPSTTSEFPPSYTHKGKSAFSRRINQVTKKEGIDVKKEKENSFVPIISMGRYGKLLGRARPSDDAFVAMLESARHTIYMSLQDLGPVKIPGIQRALPGLRWPTEYIDALATVIWERNVIVRIVLSNPSSIPGDLYPLDAYGNGWTCVDVASEIAKAILRQYPHQASDVELRKKICTNLQLCYMRCRQGGTSYQDGNTIGLHTKYFIIDDICCYVGSQNLYICDLAEWGVVIDDVTHVKAMKEQYWDVMWEVCYTGNDCHVDDVTDGMKIDRGPLIGSETMISCSSCLPCRSV